MVQSRLEFGTFEDQQLVTVAKRTQGGGCQGKGGREGGGGVISLGALDCSGKELIFSSG